MFMALASLKHYGKWDYFVEDVNAKWGMRELIVVGKIFSNFPRAGYATDVTFQQTNIPYGLCEDRSIYYSGKHKLHDYKVELSVLPTGKTINCTQHYQGHVSDIEVFRKNQPFHLQNLQKSEEDKRLQVGGPLETKYPDGWALLADKGYQGLSTHFRAITPNKKQPGETLSIEQLNENDRISHDRVLVENWSYNIMFKPCVALINYHVHLSSLRAEDSDNYHNYLGRLLSIEEEAYAVAKALPKEA
ncbi:hypothetical protein PHMEG_00017718 [Phytophthora megakarya]|uniref:DDE Tnp4 domain-containing protein n=1 Tax=Phytophthora megakarya TaxID=4795 RepID=A0A225VXD2_9STRA|nr:hypothetical protein PHMEG_00017718 [Phytophthora megakarya]